jgi:hypothetical protein
MTAAPMSANQSRRGLFGTGANGRDQLSVGLRHRFYYEFSTTCVSGRSPAAPQARRRFYVGETAVGAVK